MAWFAVAVPKIETEGRIMSLEIRPCTLKQANEYVENFHRHHKPDRGHRFSLAAWQDNQLVGVAICGRPKARAIDQYRVLEVTRLATNGVRNVCSFLLGRCAKIARLMGFESIQTYILASEPGTSLRAAGWVDEGINRASGIGWTNRIGRAKELAEPKRRFVKKFKVVKGSERN